MKTLYIDINNEQINSTEELEVLSYDLDNDFFFHLGEKIANGCNVKNEARLITDFNTPENKDAYNDIISQWGKLKEILFSENCRGNFNFTLPEDYIHWLKFNINAEYISIYDANFSNKNSAVIHINLNDLYDDTIGYLQRKISHILQKDNLHLKIKEFIFNDNTISPKSPIVKFLKNRYGQIGFCHHNKYAEHTENKLLPKKSQLNNEPIKTKIIISNEHRKAIANVINALQAKRFSWQTDEYLAIIKQDQECQKNKYLATIKQGQEYQKNRDSSKEDNTDNAGNYIYKYMEAFDIILKHTTKYNIKARGGRPSGTFGYKLPNGIHCRFNSDKTVSEISIYEDTPLPLFYKGIGINWGDNKIKIKNIFEYLGFSVTEEQVDSLPFSYYIYATGKCYKYNYSIKITASIILNELVSLQIANL